MRESSVTAANFTTVNGFQINQASPLLLVDANVFLILLQMMMAIKLIRNTINNNNKRIPKDCVSPFLTVMRTRVDGGVLLVSLSHVLTKGPPFLKKGSLSNIDVRKVEGAIRAGHVALAHRLTRKTT